MRGYFHTDRDIDLATLAEAITRADATGASFRINVENGVLTYKVGGGSWSPPMRSTVDAYRDAPLDWEQKVLTNDEQARMCLPNTIGGIPRSK